MCISLKWHLILQGGSKWREGTWEWLCPLHAGRTVHHLWRI
jgi:hypothetical protein